MDVFDPNQVVEPVESDNSAVKADNNDSSEAIYDFGFLTSRRAVIDKLKELINAPVSDIKGQIDVLKSIYYKLRKQETDDLKAKFVEEGNSPEEFKMENDELESELKELLNQAREKKAEYNRLQEEEKENNLKRKGEILEQIKQLCESPDDVSRHYSEFQELQTKWKEITNLPQAGVSELWKNYQHAVEHFYDLLKINKELREYDFKKNYELKIALCEAAEKLSEETDVISSFHSLQKFHNEWREIGPVSREFRESLWQRFKDASTVINKKHQLHFESLRGKEQENEAAKVALCEKMEALDVAGLNSYQKWDEKAKEVIELQEEWKKIGFASKKTNNQLFERFRKACDAFFNAKYAYIKSMKEELLANLEQKKALCDQAEALKESTEWKETSDKLIELQKEWKKIGAVPKKHSDAVWKRFVSACDYFFEQKKSNSNSTRDIERNNLSLKRAIIEKVKAIDESLDQSDIIDTIKGLVAEFNAVGHVPFKEKDKIYKEFHDLVDSFYKKFSIKSNDRKVSAFKSNVSRMAQGDRSESAILRERRGLMKQYETLKQDLQTYENNMGFLSFSSKGSNKLQNEMEKKIQKLKDEMELLAQKINIIDETLDA